MSVTIKLSTILHSSDIINAMEKMEIESGTIIESDDGTTILNIKGGREVTQTDVQELFIECNKFTKKKQGRF